MPASFVEGQNSFAPKMATPHFAMERKGSRFYQKTIYSAADGDAVTWTPIALVYGARGKNDVAFFTARDDGFWELPVAWLNPQEQWGLGHYNPTGGGDHSRKLTPRCLDCHNTWFDQGPAPPSEDLLQNCVLGVTCERCHGPGSAHVDFHRQHPLERTAQAIVHPGRLVRERQTDLCAQCHGNAVKPLTPAFEYRPGQPLDKYFKTTVNPYPEMDAVANQAEHMRQSKCFQMSDSLTCITCHDPHRVPDRAAVHRACQDCHEVAECRARDRLPPAVSDDCVGCHMPTLNKVQVSYDTETAFCVPPVRRWEHRIGVYPFAEEQVLRDWYVAQADDESRQLAGRLTDSLRKYWLDQAQAYESEHRFLVAIDAYRRALELASDDAVGARLESLINRHLEVNRLFVEAISQSDRRQYVEAAATLEKVLAIKPNEALAHGKLGALYATLGDKARATEHLQAVAKYDPNSAYGFGMLGWIAYLDNRPAEAIRQYRLADEVEPHNAKIHYQMGLAFVQQGDLSMAASHLRQSLAIEPNQLAGIVALSRALVGQGETQEGYELALRGVQLTGGKDADSLLALAYASAAIGRLVEAEGAARQALALTASTNPPMAAQIRAALEEFRARSGGIK